MAMNDISLTAGMRSNLVALQGTVDLLNRTQERLSTGKKVNTALDNPLNFFAAKDLNSRAADLAGFKDGMSEAVQTIKAANTGISAIEGLIAQAKAVAATAKAGVSGGSGDYLVTVDLASVTNGQTITVGTAGTFTAVATDSQVSIAFGDITSAGATISVGGVTFTAVATAGAVVYAATQFEISGGTNVLDATAFLRALNISTGQTAGSTNSSGVVTLTHVISNGVVTGSGTYAVATSSTVDLLDTEFLISTSTTLDVGTNGVTATNLAAKLVGSDSTAPIVNAYADAAQINLWSGTADITAGSVVTAVASLAKNEYQITADRKSYAAQFKTIMDQLDLLATDSSYKGINFLAADNTLDVEFGKTTGDKITLTSFDASAVTLLGKNVKYAQNSWKDNAAIDLDLAKLATATATLTTESSRLSSQLSIINTRQDWVKGIVNTVTEGADKLTLADMNEEGANMLMLQTRQTLGTTALSLSAQAAQSVLRLFA